MSDDPQALATLRRDVTSPWRMPLSGWKEVVFRTYTELIKDRITLIGAGVAFFWMLAIFPAIAAGVSIWALFADPHAVQKTFDQLGGVIPAEASELIGNQLAKIADTTGDTLGVSAVIGFLFLVWSANAGMKSLMDGLNVIWDTPEERGLLWLNIWSLGLLLLVFLFGAVAVTSFALLPAAVKGFGIEHVLFDVWGVLRWPVLGLVAAVLVAVVYRFGPSRPPPHWRWLSPGAALATVGFLVVSYGFSLYVAHFDWFDATYGSLAGAVVTLMWLWLSAVVVLVGGELDAELEHQTLALSATAGP